MQKEPEPLFLFTLQLALQPILQTGKTTKRALTCYISADSEVSGGRAPLTSWRLHPSRKIPIISLCHLWASVSNSYSSSNEIQVKPLWNEIRSPAQVQPRNITNRHRGHIYHFVLHSQFKSSHLPVCHSNIPIYFPFSLDKPIYIIFLLNYYYRKLAS